MLETWQLLTCPFLLGSRVKFLNLDKDFKDRDGQLWLSSLKLLFKRISSIDMPEAT